MAGDKQHERTRNRILLGVLSLRSVRLHWTPSRLRPVEERMAAELTYRPLLSWFGPALVPVKATR